MIPMPEAHGNPEFEQLCRRFRDLRRATVQGDLAPNKPFLILLMLARYQKGQSTDIPFDEVKTRLRSLLQSFPPYGSNVLDPFWRLQNDPSRIWTVTDDAGSRIAERVDPPSETELLDRHARGNFTPSVRTLLREHPDWLPKLAGLILRDNFPATLHPDIAKHLGLEITTEPDQPEEKQEPGAPRRDPEFRERVLAAYDYRCAVTGWDLHLHGHGTVIGVEAAHIRWHVAGGPCAETNGLALNALHHKLFDYGVFTLTLDPVPRIVVSAQAYGHDAVQNILLASHGKPIHAPRDNRFLPDPEFIQWHRRKVFCGKERPVQA